MVDVTFGENDEWMWTILQDIDRCLHRLHVRSLTIHAKASASLHRNTIEPIALVEDLPCRHEIEWARGCPGCFEQAVGIPMKGMIRRQQDTLLASHRFFEMLQASQFHALYLLFAKCIGAQEVSAKKPPWRHFRWPMLVWRSIWLNIH
jgi:hypothetical protein